MAVSGVTMAAPVALTALTAALVSLSPPPLVSIEESIDKPSFCDGDLEEERVVRVLEGMPPSGQPFADPDDTPEQVWASRCASCHAMNGSAETRMGRMHNARSFTDPKWQACRTRGDIRAVIERGVAGSKMRAFKAHLTESQLEGLVQLIRDFDMRISLGRPIEFAQ